MKANSKHLLQIFVNFFHTLYIGSQMKFVLFSVMLLQSELDLMGKW